MNGRKLIIAAAFLLFCWNATFASVRTRAQQSVTSSLNSEPFRSGVCAVLAVRMNGDTLVSINPRQKLVPASTTKLITTGIGLKVLGADYRYSTSLGYSGTIKDSTLVGDLYIMGGGDPTTGSRSKCSEPSKQLFAKWQSLLLNAGIRRIEGRIIGDPRFFDDPCAQSTGWSNEDLGCNYGAGPTGLNFFENAQNFYVTPGAAPGVRPFISPRYPETPWMQYCVSATTGAPRTENSLWYVTSRFGPYGEFFGSFPADRRGYTLECSNPFGAYTCAFHFYKYLNANGITCTGGYGDVSPQGYIRTDLQFSSIGRRAAARKELAVIGRTCSPALKDIVADTNAESDNFFAETIFRTVGLTLEGSSRQDSCVAAMERELAALGLRTVNSCRVYDGSGLSRKNYISPGFFVAFLRAMVRTSVFPEFFASLPLPGQVNSTLETRFREAPRELKDRIHMKSGSMNGVRCFSGYITTPDADPRHTVVFCVMTNNVTATSPTAMPVIEDIIAAIAAEN